MVHASHVSLLSVSSLFHGPLLLGTFTSSLSFSGFRGRIHPLSVFSRDYGGPEQKTAPAVRSVESSVWPCTDRFPPLLFSSLFFSGRVSWLIVSPGTKTDFQPSFSFSWAGCHFFRCMFAGSPAFLFFLAVWFLSLPRLPSLSFKSFSRFPPRLSFFLMTEPFTCPSGGGWTSF